MTLFFGVVLLFLAGAAFPSRTWQKSLRNIAAGATRFSERKALASAVVLLGVILLRLAVLPRLPVPIPGIHDEFSYLLMADTFAHGRLANPPHPMWMSFETFHVNFLPTYSSMYPPAQGAVLALGQLLGSPWIGVLLSTAAMCAAIVWALQAWMPPQWALLGGVLAGLKFGVANYWMNSYWGGAVAGLAGALALGAIVRILRKPRTWDAILLGVSVALLANSRPFEGLLFCVPIAAVFLWWIAGKTKDVPEPRVRWRTIFLPLAAVLALTAGFMGYYNWRLTGGVLLFPHTLNRQTYHTGAMFVWQKPGEERSYHNAQFEEFYNVWLRGDYQGWQDFRRITELKIARDSSTFLWAGLWLLLPWMLAALRDRELRLPLVTLFFVVLGVLSIVWANPHYGAPATCALFAWIAQAMRRACSWQFRNMKFGAALVMASVALLAINVGGNVSKGYCDPLRWPCEGDPSRAAIQQRLEHEPGKHVVIVRYSEDHNIHDDWVYNGADLDGAKVLWARDVSPEQDAKLLAYYKDRTFWLVEPDTENTRLLPYSASMSPALTK